MPRETAITPMAGYWSSFFNNPAMGCNNLLQLTAIIARRKQIIENIGVRNMNCYVSMCPQDVHSRTVIE